MKYPNSHLTPFPPTFPRKIVCNRIQSAGNCARAPALPLSTFKINTSKSVSKQRTLTPSRMNTYAKNGGGVGLRLLLEICRCSGRALRAASERSKRSSKLPAFHPVRVDLLSLCFHKLAKPSSRKPFVFTSIQNPRGGAPPAFHFQLSTLHPHARREHKTGGMA
jgi:hypothetical protein